MKKIAVLLLTMALLVACAACDAGTPVTTTAPETTAAPTTAAPTTTAAPETVTVYIPTIQTAYDAGGNVIGTSERTYEDGWFEKESFTVTNSEGSIITYESGVCTIVYNGTDVERFVAEYDDRGYAICSTLYYRQESQMYAAGMALQTTVSEYDDRGLLVKQTVVSKSAEGVETPMTDLTYTYQKTDTGYTGVGVMEGIELQYLVECNAAGQVLTQSMDQGNGMVYRAVNTYDDHGNCIRTAQYMGEELLSSMEYTFAAVEVPEETAQRFPQFKTEN